MRTILIIIMALTISGVYGQKSVNPVIKSTGGIYEIPIAVEKPDRDLVYKVVIDMQTADSDPKKMAFSVNNLARMINLHSIGGAENMEIVGVLHSTSTRAVLTDEAYKKRYGVINPNSAVIKELASKGVKLFVCGQSMIARGVAPEEVLDEIKVATAALTVLTTYQLQGFAHLRF